MVRVRDSPQCAICEFVMKQLESMLEDQTTEVGYATLDLLDVSSMGKKLYKTAAGKLVSSLLTCLCLRRRWSKLWRRCALSCPPVCLLSVRTWLRPTARPSLSCWCSRLTPRLSAQLWHSATMPAAHMSVSLHSLMHRLNMNISFVMSCQVLICHILTSLTALIVCFLILPSCTRSDSLQGRWLLWCVQDGRYLHRRHSGEERHRGRDWGGCEESVQLPAWLSADWGESSHLLTLCNFDSWQPHVNPCVSCQQCDQLVQQYEPMLVQLLLQMLDPDFVCMVNTFFITFADNVDR